MDEIAVMRKQVEKHHDMIIETFTLLRKALDTITCLYGSYTLMWDDRSTIYDIESVIGLPRDESGLSKMLPILDRAYALITGYFTNLGIKKLAELGEEMRTCREYWNAYYRGVT